MTTWQILLIVAGVLITFAGVLASLRARSLDRIHTNVVKSRIALERALAERAQAARALAGTGLLDPASSVLLGNIAREALDAGAFPIVDDGVADSWAGSGSAAAGGRPGQGSAGAGGRARDHSAGAGGHKGHDFAAGSPDRLAIESDLTRALRYTVDELDETDVPEGALDAIERARLNLKMTRRFHNNHVAQARRVRNTTLVRMLHLYGNAPVPQSVNLDDE